jgi:hypothetical protein
VPDTRTHRGPAPEDQNLFAPGRWPELRQAAQDLCWLLDRGYGLHSAAELVGNRHALTTRQRLAVTRCVCTSEARTRRRVHEVMPEALAGRDLWLDGFNVLTGIEVALGGGLLLLGSDRCVRDLASVYARHHEVEETRPAVQLLGTVMNNWSVRRCVWWLDRPVSNSGRLKQQILDQAKGHGWDWQVELVFNPDKILAEGSEIIATADSVILDRCQRWVNLTRLVITQHIPEAWIVEIDGK